MNNVIKPYLISNFPDEDIHTIHLLQGKIYILLARLLMNEKNLVIDKIKADHPLIANKLKNYKGGEL